MQAEFHAQEYHADGSLQTALYRFHGAPASGWTVYRNGSPFLDLGEGYALLATKLCGVCSTDLARRYLPFPLPQITGHEVVALDEAGRRFAVEINAPPIARGVATDCPFCRLLPNHCPDRLVLGIHDLPGGFGPYILAPIHALHAIPDALDDDAAVLIEPLAAALHAVETIRPANRQRVAVLGPRKLGMLVVAALAAWRRQHALDYEITAIARRPDLLAIARQVGADQAVTLTLSDVAEPLFDVVIDCTGTPDGLDLAIRLAHSEVHLKSTHGRPAAGLEHLTEFVVDELSLARFNPDALPPALERARPLLAWLPRPDPPPALAALADLHAGPSAAALLERLEAASPSQGLPRYDAAVADTRDAVQHAIRPGPNREVSLVRPRGTILLANPPEQDIQASSVLDAVWRRGLRLSSSRCGDFAAAIALLESDAALRAAAPRLITHRFAARDLSQAFEVAAGRASIKAVVRHEVCP